ncbi:MAG: replication-associated recombination protein A [Phycisphaerales bacterium]
MSDLWSGQRAAGLKAVEPLAVRMRPRTLGEIAGQAHILGEGGDEGTEARRHIGTKGAARPLLRRMLEAGSLTSIILHGPPGTGKTTLAEVIAAHLKRHFVRENAANVSVKRIREVVEDAARRLENSGGKDRTILFLDEIHRFSKSQQDVLLEDVERGRVTLIGATTENPMFAVNSALVSRSTVFRLEPLSEEDIEKVVRGALADAERGYGGLALTVTDEAIAHWARLSEGDARRALTALEVAVLSGSGGSAPGGTGLRPVSGSTPDHAGAHGDTDASVSTGRRPVPPQGIVIDLAAAEQSIQHKALVYAGDGDEHFDTISAMIKSVRGSDPDAAVYWIAKMLEAGEDPRYIARRLAVLASEDIGNADPRGIMVAEAAWSLTERLGMPECRITLAQCAIYLALAPKSNASYKAIDAALEDVREGRTIPVPRFLRDGHKVESVGTPRDAYGYQYSHDASSKTSIGGVTSQDYLGVEKRYYLPDGIGAEKVMKERLEEVRGAREGTR